MPKEIRKSRYCFICGKVSHTEGKVGYFICPKGKLESWQDMIPKTGLQINHNLCSIHFDEEDILKGRTILHDFYPYKVWRLQKNAIPKHFLECHRKNSRAPVASKAIQVDENSSHSKIKKNPNQQVTSKSDQSKIQPNLTFKRLVDSNNHYHYHAKGNEPRRKHENPSLEQSQPGPCLNNEVILNNNLVTGSDKNQQQLSIIPIDYSAISTSECVNVLSITDDLLSEYSDKPNQGLASDSTRNPSSCGIGEHVGCNVLSVDMINNTQYLMLRNDPLYSCASVSQSIEPGYCIEQNSNQSSKAVTTDQCHSLIRNGADVGLDINIGRCINCYFVEKRNQALKKIVNKKLEKIDVLRRKLKLAQRQVQRLLSGKLTTSKVSD